LRCYPCHHRVDASIGGNPDPRSTDNGHAEQCGGHIVKTRGRLAASAKNNVDYSYRIIQRLAKEDIVSLHEKGQTKKPSLSYDGIMLELTW